MKKRLLAALLFGGILTTVHAQTVDVDRTKYPDYSEKTNPDWSLMTPARNEDGAARVQSRTKRPAYVNNAETKHFPPVFNQDGGSYGSASRICYMFSYELAAYRDLDGSKAENYYPSHFVWLHTNSPTGITDQGKDAFVTKVGVPSAATYGGQTYSSLFGSQDCSNNDFGWMQGYDKWFEAMHNRMLKPSNFPVNVGTEEGREAVKNWLWNHNGDNDFQAGGICGIGVASGGVWKDIPKTKVNDSIGVSGMGYVWKWGTQVDHALTIVGYDDRIEFDLNNNGVYGEPEADELGAWIIVNSWGYWENGGFIYCPYAHGVPAFNQNGTVPNNFWTPEIYRVRKDYRPLRTIKLEMDYSRRSELALSAGISADLNATAPENTIPFVHFTYAGDGNYGNSNPAPEVPMLGRWADGKLHHEPMEFGYDLTDLTEGYDMSQPLKYFFIIESRSWAQGEGTIHNASIMDYRFDREGIETPFGVGEGVEIRNQGKKTIISVIVQGSSYYAPQNVGYADGTLTWQAPLRSASTVANYRIYADGVAVAELSGTTLSYTPEAQENVSQYGVAAVYEDGNESAMETVSAPVAASNPNTGVDFAKAGFTIPGVFANKYQQATIEYWIKPTTVANYNQAVGPGWGSFMAHANSTGQYTMGWDTSNRYNTSTVTALKPGQWMHVAIVVDGNKMTTYLNGVNRGSYKSNTYNGLGGFGDLVFSSSSGNNNAQDAVYDEIRIWSTARTKEQIKANRYTEFSGNTMPQGLIAYLKGDLFTDAEGNVRMRDCVGGHHATLQGANYTSVTEDLTELTAPTGAPTVSIDAPTGTLYAGIPVALAATYSETVDKLSWTAAGAGVENLIVASPTLTFAKAGTHTVSVTATAHDGSTATATLDITLEAAPAPDASFTMTAEKVPAGERVTLHATDARVGYLYEWSMPGADKPTAASPSVATSWQSKGQHKVTLTVTAPDGTKASKTQTVEVDEVAPKADFSIDPAVVLKGEEVKLNDMSKYTPLTRRWTITSGGINYVVYADVESITIDQPGVYDVALDVTNHSGSDRMVRERALIVTNADSKNGLRFSNHDAAVTATKVPLTAGAKAFTIEWWMNSEWPSDNINGIGDTENTLLINTMGGGKMQILMGEKSAASAANYVVPGEWHHYAVVLDGGKAYFYRDGLLNTTRPLSGALPELAKFRIGGAKFPFTGSIDEVRVWSKALSYEQVIAYANTPIEDVAKAEKENGLVLYYNFNQNSGDVQDATSNANHGVRTSFGPDGDAWGLSKGVFCLGSGKTEDVTNKYLSNYAAAFRDNNKCINPNLPARTFSLFGWTLENTVTNGNIITGAHVDRGKSSCFTVTTGWDGFATTINDHKAYQTITLPAGFYTFIAEYGSFEGQCGQSYLVAAQGKGLPNTEDLDEAISYAAMKPKGVMSSNSVSFLLEEETTVSIGLVVNMSGESCLTLQRFILTKSQAVVYGETENIPGGIESVAVDVVAPKGIYDLMGRQLRADSNHTEGLAPGIYIIDGRKVVIK